jgi:hypothetical protein
MTTRAPLDPFETALLSELRAHVAGRAPRPARSPRRRLAAVGATAAAAAALTVGALALRPDPAFSVEPQADGDVVVTISSAEAADELEAALEEAGIEADVSYQDQEASSPPPAGGDDGGRSLDESGTIPDSVDVEGRCTIGVRTGDDGAAIFTVPAAVVDSEETLRIILTGGDDGDGLVVAVSVPSDVSC